MAQPGAEPPGDWEAASSRRRRRHLHHRRHWVAGGLAVAVSLLVAGSAAALVVLTRAPDAVIGCRLSARRPRLVGGDTRLTAADGSRLGFVPTGSNREPVALRRVSPWVRRATVAIEDRRFWHHGALDPIGLARSAVADVTSGAVVQGGSTLTQQLVRNRYLDGEQMTVGRKLTEACLAVELFRRWTRPQILDTYLNSVFYGEHARGVEAAAWTYFSRPASRLGLTQSALLAGLPQAPTVDDPLRHPRRALRRRAEVLAAMRRAGELSPARYRAALVRPLRLHPGDRYRRLRFGTFFAAARADLDRRLGRARVRHGALRVRTTLDPHLQRLAQRALDGWIADPAGPAAALVAIDPRSGAVRAMATRAPGRLLRFNLATQARRQAGSAFKVFTLATALEQGIGLGSTWHGPPSLTIPDPRCMNATGPWVVHNFADESSGTMTLADAIAHSVNTIFAQVAVRVGPEAIVRTAHRMGVRSPLAPVCSITLGPEGVSPLEMADAFATLAADGVHHRPQLVTRATTAGGRKLIAPVPGGQRALAPGIAARVTAALAGVIRHGTGMAADPGRPAAGKTGTAEEDKDAWFCGYVPQLAACVWMGRPEGEVPMTAVDGFSPVVGGGVPARIWHDFMTAALAGAPVRPLPGFHGPWVVATPSPSPSAAPTPAVTPSPTPPPT